MAQSLDNQEPRASVPIVFPCAIEDFREFVSGLLGKPQQIEGIRTGSFSIDRTAIEQAYHLIEQRVLQQNGVHPLTFSVRIVYDDGTSVQLNSLRDFQTFHETKPVISTQVHLTLTYLIQFPTKKVSNLTRRTVSTVVMPVATK